MNRYQNNLDVTSMWLYKHALAPSGALKYTDTVIHPYFANYAAIGLTRNPATPNLVLAGHWMKWYLDHWNYDPVDRWGMQGTIYDYSYDAATHAEKSLENADSTDSYAATFLSLAWALYSTGNHNLQAYVRAQHYPLEMIGGVILKTLDEHLTWAKPDYKIKYLMDNCEVYRGLRDLAALWAALGEKQKSDYYTAVADPMLKAINTMWLGDAWEPNKDAGEPKSGVWYPDAVVQLFPVLMGIVDAHDKRADQVYMKFCKEWPNWDKLSFTKSESFPWVLVACAAALMGDLPRVDSYLTTIEYKFQGKGFPWPWYSMEAGWYLRLNAYMMGKRPL